jgi:hypothetical protein
LAHAGEATHCSSGVHALCDAVSAASALMANLVGDFVASAIAVSPAGD